MVPNLAKLGLLMCMDLNLITIGLPLSMVIQLDAIGLNSGMAQILIKIGFVHCEMDFMAMIGLALCMGMSLDYLLKIAQVPVTFHGMVWGEVDLELEVMRLASTGPGMTLQGE